MRCLDIPDLPIRAFIHNGIKGRICFYKSATDVVDTVTNGISDIGNTISNGVSDLGQSIGDIGNQIDKTVRKDVPGGWATVGAAALMAAGITNPELLSSAEEGTLSSEELANAGITTDQAQAIAEVANPETAMANFQAGNIPAAEAYKAGVSASDLINSGASISDVASAGNEAVNDLYYSGTSLSDLTKAGVSVDNLIASGIDPNEILKEGTSLSKIISEGGNVQNLVNNGTSINDLIKAGAFTPADTSYQSEIDSIINMESEFNPKLSVESNIKNAQILKDAGIKPSLIEESMTRAGLAPDTIKTALESTTTTPQDLANALRTDAGTVQLGNGTSLSADAATNPLNQFNNVANPEVQANTGTVSNLVGGGSDANLATLDATSSNPLLPTSGEATGGSELGAKGSIISSGEGLGTQTLSDTLAPTGLSGVTVNDLQTQPTDIANPSVTVSDVVDAAKTAKNIANLLKKPTTTTTTIPTTQSLANLLKGTPVQGASMPTIYKAANPFTFTPQQPIQDTLASLLRNNYGNQSF
jgi:hypothetical protein